MCGDIGYTFFISVGKDEPQSIIFTKINNWMGAMFCNHQPVNVIDEMTYSDLKYWNRWHEIMQKAYTNASEGKGK